MKNNKGLSAVVTTLIIILLTIVAIMIIWGVVRGLLDNSSNTIDKSTKCLEIDIQATKVINTSDGNYSVTVTRTAGGEDIIEGLEIILSSDTDASDVLDTAEGFAPMNMKTYSIYKLGLANVTTARVSAYFTDDNGEKQRCPETTYTFKAVGN
jgi:flagellin-like protein